MFNIIDIWHRILRLFFHNRTHSIHIKIGYEVNYFLPEDIIRIEANGSYCMMYTLHGNFMISRNLSLVEKELKGFGFIRINRSNIIGVVHISRVIKGSRSYVLMDDGKKIYIPFKKENKILSQLDRVRK